MTIDPQAHRSALGRALLALVAGLLATGCVSEIVVDVVRAPVTPTVLDSPAAAPSGSIAVVLGQLDNDWADFVSPDGWANATVQALARTGLFSRVVPPGAPDAEAADVRLVVDAHLGWSQNYVLAALKAIAVGITFFILDPALPQRAECDAVVTWTVTDPQSQRVLRSEAAVNVAWHASSSTAILYSQIETRLRELTLADLAAQVRAMREQPGIASP